MTEAVLWLMDLYAYWTPSGMDDYPINLFVNDLDEVRWAVTDLDSHTDHLFRSRKRADKWAKRKRAQLAHRRAKKFYPIGKRGKAE